MGIYRKNFRQDPKVPCFFGFDVLHYSAIKQEAAKALFKDTAGSRPCQINFQDIGL